jgi:hypothetical protein
MYFQLKRKEKEMQSYRGISGKDIDLTAQAIISKRSMLVTNANTQIDKIQDEDWIRKSFLVPRGSTDKRIKTLRTFSSGEFKYEDSSLGGSTEVNPRPQFTPYCDTRVNSGISFISEVSLDEVNPRVGIGHYYSEAIHDNSQIIHMRFGVPQFTSMTTFFTGFYSDKAGSLAKTARGEINFFESVGETIGLVVMVLAWPLLVASILGGVANFLLGKPSSKYYYLKPAMPLYWNAVNTMVNQIATNRGLYPQELDTKDKLGAGGAMKIDKASMEAFNRMMPDVFSKDGGIDVYNVANRAKRMSRALEAAIAEGLQSFDDTDLFIERYRTALNGVDTTNKSIESTIRKALNRWFGVKMNKFNAEDKVLMEKDYKDSKPDGSSSYPDGFEQILSAEYDDASAFASFKVDYTGPTNESFSNSAVESEIASKFNSISSGSKSSYFSFSGGNIAPIFSDITQAVADVATGILNEVKLGGIVALAGGAFVDIPKHWENSTASFNKNSYTIDLISPYGNVISQMINIYIPLSMLLAAVLPIQTGKQSYSSPFLVEMYDRGRQQTRLGIIESLTVSRGTSNLGFTKDGKALAMKVTFSVLDLSSVMSMPITAQTFLAAIGNTLNPTNALFDDDNSFTDYMNTLAGVSLQQQIYKISKLRLRWANKMKKLSALTSPGAFAGFMHSWPVVGDLDIFFRGSIKK